MYICYCKIVCKHHAVINEQTLWNDSRLNAAKITVLNCTLCRDNPAQYTFITTHFIKICLFRIHPFTSFLHWPFFLKFQVIFFLSCLHNSGRVTFMPFTLLLCCVDNSIDTARVCHAVGDR